MKVYLAVEEYWWETCHTLSVHRTFKGAWDRIKSRSIGYPMQANKYPPEYYSDSIQSSKRHVSYHVWEMEVEA